MKPNYKACDKINVHRMPFIFNNDCLPLTCKVYIQWKYFTNKIILTCPYSEKICNQPIYVTLSN